MASELDWLRITDQHASVSELAYRSLRRGILSCRLAPGTRLSVAQLSSRMGISRTPVRDALQRLEQDGLIITVPRSHTCVAPLSRTQLDELYHIRLILERPAVELALSHMARDGVAALQRLVAEANQLLQDGEAARFAANNDTFHTVIYQAIPNGQLRHLIQDLRSRSERYIITFTQAPGRDQQILEEHGEIVAALAERNVALASALLVSHLETAWEGLRQQLALDGKQEGVESIAQLSGDGAGGIGDLSHAGVPHRFSRTGPNAAQDRDDRHLRERHPALARSAPIHLLPEDPGP